ncbi:MULTISPECIES: hypothetical protein [Thalassospira]|uniref:Uncharacterized protein n=1 Tax=Thalassospira profundimaris TaxID=502049 RepID=A0A367V7U1_9PROT|nr:MULTISPECIES: hypothetical protein [Thalassospira]KZB73265.1 hypothetical protein AUQ43_18485 [Thalassospira sp. MCCC 1A01148]RCK21089.1 hypothetical protein TH6_15105 [Thalassospira profundimaris]
MMIDSACSPVSNEICRQWLAFSWETVLAGGLGLVGGWLAFKGATIDGRVHREGTRILFREQTLTECSFFVPTDKDGEPSETGTSIYESKALDDNFDDSVKYCADLLTISLPDIPPEIANKELAKYRAAVIESALAVSGDAAENKITEANMRTLKGRILGYLETIDNLKDPLGH